MNTMLPLHASIGMKYDMTMSERVLLKSYLCPDLIEGSEQVSCNCIMTVKLMLNQMYK